MLTDTEAAKEIKAIPEDLDKSPEEIAAMEKAKAEAASKEEDTDVAAPVVAAPPPPPSMC